MPAYAKIALVTSGFHPSDIAFARGWSAAAPGFGGWTLVLDREDAPQLVSVVPPGADEPAFIVTRGPRDARLQRLRPGAVPQEIGRLPGLREALLMLCPLPDDALVKIQERLEVEFPRRERRGRR